MEPTPYIECGGTEELAKAKIVARQKLLAMEPKEAQKLVDMTLYPQYWSCDPASFTWCGSLDVSDCDDETDS
ncbi:MAG: hypothetical protein KME17_05085 [Cyanosarcina radialis HA8281-LM2]|jgi:hypothetical protein|nr:hypothetical protein [Cyanosarcina radialis HA8281-LM2]